MHFLFTVNRAYAPYLGATIVSLLESQNKEEELHFHVLSSDFDIKVKSELEKLKLQRPFSISYYEEKDCNVDFSPFARRGGVPIEAYYRCFAHEALKDISRVIHLDVDLLVLRDLSKLWAMDLGNCFAAGLPHPSLNGSHLSLTGFDPNKHIYCQAGVNLFDLDAMRRAHITQDIVDLFEEYNCLFFAYDQDLVSAVFGRKMKALDLSYNMVIDPCPLQSPHIVHFSQRLKPWHDCCQHPYTEQYRNCLKKTTWGETALVKLPWRKKIALSKAFTFLIQKTKKAAPCRKLNQAIIEKGIAKIHKRLVRDALGYNRKINFQGLQDGQKIFTHLGKCNPGFFYHQKMLGCPFVDTLEQADALMIWGTGYFWGKFLCLVRARRLKRPLLIGEDGFIRSIDVAINNGPGLSCCVDHTGVFYDFTQPNLIQSFLNGKEECTRQEKEAAREAMRLILEKEVSKYNLAAPQKIDFNADRKYRSVVLVIDQHYNDQSVCGAGADETTFARMLGDAITENPDSLILVKTHPDSAVGPFQGYYDTLVPQQKNVRLLTETMNPISLLKAVDKIYVVSSQMGMEALICGKQVLCYAAPFYSGWGPTTDRGTKASRSRTRSIEDLFFAAYLKYTHYYNPQKKERCSLPELLCYLEGERNRVVKTKGM